MALTGRKPCIVVFSSLFPSARQPGAGLFVRERMFRVGHELPLCVVAPAPWFPLQGLVRRWRPGFRVGAPRHERQSSFDVWYPRFLSIPGVLKQFDGLFMALGAWPRLRRLKREGRLDIIDAHFAYPDGYAATLLGRWLDVPVTITLRGTEARQARDPRLAGRLRQAALRAARVFSVSQSLRSVLVDLGIPADHIRVVGNGVDLHKFAPVPRGQARDALRMPAQARVLVTVGGLVERKGIHRVIACLPSLRARHPGLTYLVVGGASAEGDMSDALRQQALDADLVDAVRFLGPLPPEQVRIALSAADVFVLATRNEGWANVFLEAMACGLPVVTTDVGGNTEVVCDPRLGIVVPFDDTRRLEGAIDAALRTHWDAAAIREHAACNTWAQRVQILVQEFVALHARLQASPSQAQRAEHA
jgi:teichuronic acid biosynthesis glycosyltransferase TuaC